ncbi:MAG: glycosyltransferase family 4 protein [Solirubrobacterales bacterium]
MRVLLITPAAPSKAHVNGGATRMHRLYRRLLERGDEVTVAAVFTADEAGGVEALREEGFAVEPYVRPRGRGREILRALIRRPGLLRLAWRMPAKELISAVFWVDLAPLVHALLNDRAFDVVVIESSFAAWWRADFETDLPVVLVTHEVESVQQMAKATRVGGPAGLARYVNGARIRRSEARWTPEFDGVVVMSESERLILEQVVGKARLPQTFVVGNGADLSAMESVDSDPGAARVLFTGTMAYPPNAVGAQWLAREVWPSVLAARPDAVLEIVGAAPSRATLALGDLTGISVHADVPDMREWFSRASVCTLPMIEGGGTRLKLADAFAARRAVVSTTNGATGIDCSDGREVLIADSAEDFARAIVRLLDDSELRARLAGRGRTLAERLYDWDVLGDQLAGALQSVIAAQSAAPLEVVRSAKHA